MSSLQWQTPSFWIILAIVLALGMAALLYARNTEFNNQPLWVRYTLGLLRFLGILGILILLLNPLIKTSSNEEIKPILLVAKDASKSVLLEDKAEDINRAVEIIDADWLNQVYDVRHLNFDSEVRFGQESSFTGEGTNLSSLFSFIKDQYRDRNLAGALLITDGIFNQGYNPVSRIQQLNAPIYAVALGDTTRPKDLEIKNIFHNQTAVLNDAFEVQIDLSAYNLSGSQTTLEVTRLSPSAKKLEKKIIKINQSDWFKTVSIELKADISGLHHYRVKLLGLKGEKSMSNNIKDFYVEIIDSRTKILAFGNGPHPDLGMLKRIAELANNIELDIAYLNDIDDYNSRDYDLVIYHDLPNNSSKSVAHIENLRKTGKPYIIFLGGRTDINQFNAIQSAVSVSRKSSQMNYVNGKINSSFTRFKTDEIALFPWAKSAPIKSIYGDFELKLGAEVLIEQKIGQVETDYPLIALQSKPNKHAVICGTGWWKLRMFEPNDSGVNTHIDQLFTKLIQFLTVREDKRPFKLSSTKKLYNSNESVVIKGVLLNSNYENITDSDVKLIFTDENGKSYDYLMDRRDQNYHIEIDGLPSGNYSYSGQVKYSGKVLTASGKISVSNLQLESFHSRARHDILNEMARKSNGMVTSLDKIDTLKEILLKSDKRAPILSEKILLRQLIDLKFLLGLIALFFFLEWALRKYFGSY